MSISDISPVSGLAPKSQYFEQVDDVCMNVDACLKMMDEIDNERTRIIKKSFRLQLAIVRSEQPDLDAEKQREEAFFRALDALGVKTNFTKIDGVFD